MEITHDETNDEDLPLSRPQRRLLRRLYNGRTTPIIVNDRPFLTYKEAARHLLTLEGEARDLAYAQMRAFAAGEDASEA